MTADEREHGGREYEAHSQPAPPTWAHQEAHAFWREIASAYADMARERARVEEPFAVAGQEQRHGYGRRRTDAYIADAPEKVADETATVIERWGRRLVARVTLIGAIGTGLLMVLNWFGVPVVGPGKRTAAVERKADSALRFSDSALRVGLDNNRKINGVLEIVQEIRFGNCLTAHRSDPQHLPQSCYAVLRAQGVDPEAILR